MKEWKCNHCGRCCGPVPFTIKMWNRFKHLAQRPYELKPFPDNLVIPISKTPDCVFLNKSNGKNICVIYNNRPVVCRKFGNNHLLELKCHQLTTDAEKEEMEERINFFLSMGKEVKA